MTSPLTVQDLMERNRLYAASDHTPFPSLKEVASRGGSLSTVIVSCVDARVQPEKFFSIKPGEAFVLKTVAGHPQGSLQDIIVLDTLSPLTHLVVMHHTDCGATHVTDEGIRSKLISRLPDKKAEIEGMSFGAISSLEESLKNDVDWLRTQPLIRRELASNTVGLIYDLHSGEVREVV